jgi:hypothetical protein
MRFKLAAAAVAAAASLATAGLAGTAQAAPVRHQDVVRETSGEIHPFGNPFYCLTYPVETDWHVVTWQPCNGVNQRWNLVFSDLPWFKALLVGTGRDNLCLGFARNSTEIAALNDCATENAHAAALFLQQDGPHYTGPARILLGNRSLSMLASAARGDTDIQLEALWLRDGESGYTQQLALPFWVVKNI